MRIWNVLPLLCSALLGTGCIYAQGWGGCKVKEPRTASVDASGATLVRITGKAGWLKVRGESGASAVEVDGEACASKQSNLDDIKLIAERRGDEVVIEAVMPDSWGDGGALDLDITVPASVSLVMQDGSGGVEIQGVGAVDLKDGSGGVEINDIAGDVRVRDGSGGLTIDGVQGAVFVHDGSGGIDVEHVSGNVTIERDGSGGIRVADVGGDFVVERDGSGGVSSERIAGDTRISE